MDQPQSAAMVCPYLGLPDDDGSHFSFADLAHRCWAKMAGKPERIALEFQSTACLAGRYQGCGRYRAADRPVPAWHPAAVDSPALANRLRSPRRQTPSRAYGVVALAVVAALALLTWVVFVGLGHTPGSSAPTNFGAGIASPSASPPPSRAPATPVPATAAPATPTPSPTATASPTPTASPSPTPEITLGPTATPAPPSPTPLVHTVARGETLRYIARLYGVTVDEIVAANELADPNRIYIGQQLVIPTQ